MRPPDDEQFTTFVHTAWPALYRTAYLLLGERSLAEDLVQTCLAKTYASWRRVRSLDAAPAYARRVPVNTAASWFRRTSWRNEQPTDRLPESGHEPDSSLRPVMLDALRTLPPRQRAVIVLRFYEDLDVRTTAAVLDCSEGTVKSQTSAALDKLRDVLEDPTLALEETHDRA